MQNSIKLLFKSFQIVKLIQNIKIMYIQISWLHVNAPQLQIVKKNLNISIYM